MARDPKAEAAKLANEYGHALAIKEAQLSSGTIRRADRQYWARVVAELKEMVMLTPAKHDVAVPVECSHRALVGGVCIVCDVRITCPAGREPYTAGGR